MTSNVQLHNQGGQDLFGRLSLQSPEAIDFEMEIAGIGARSHAFLIDWHIRILLALAWLLAVGSAFSSWHQIGQLIWEDHSTTVFYILVVPPLLIYFLYHPVLEILMTGRTPGKRMTGIRLVTLQGLTPGTGALLLRNVFRLLDSLPAFYVVGLVTVALTANQVRIGDLAGGLVLVYDKEIKQKDLQRVADLAMHSLLSIEDQSILLDILKRWNHLQIDARVRVAEQFLDKIGEPLPKRSKNRTHYSKALKTQLRLLMNKKPEVRA